MVTHAKDESLLKYIPVTNAGASQLPETPSARIPFRKFLLSRYVVQPLPYDRGSVPLFSASY